MRTQRPGLPEEGITSVDLSSMSCSNEGDPAAVGEAPGDGTEGENYPGFSLTAALQIPTSTSH